MPDDNHRTPYTEVLDRYNLTPDEWKAAPEITKRQVVQHQRLLQIIVQQLSRHRHQHGWAFDDPYPTDDFDTYRDMIRFLTRSELTVEDIAKIEAALSADLLAIVITD